MNKAAKKTATLTAVDIGSAKIKVLIADNLGDGSLSLCGFGEAPANGVREGLVVDIEKTAAALGNALKEAEIMSNRKIGPVTVAVSGENIEGITAKGSSVISDDTVSVSEVNKVLEMSRTEVPDQKNVRILATLERGYEIDGQKGIMRPEGMTGRRLSGDVYLLFASHNALANMEKCILQAGAQVEGDFVFSALRRPNPFYPKTKKILACVWWISAPAFPKL